MESKQKPIQFPIIVGRSGAMSIEDFLIYAEERIKFEKSMNPLIRDFCEYLITRNYTKLFAKSAKEFLENFIGYLSLYTSITDLSQVSRVEACSQYTKYLNKFSFDIKYQTDNKEARKLFFIFLHKHKGISNTKVLKGLCNKDELLDLAVT